MDSKENVLSTGEKAIKVLRNFKDRVNDSISKEEKDLELLKKYCLRCYEKEDWHGVEDAGSDIRDTLAKISAYREVLKFLE